jgi:HEAT repeat protein
MLLLPALARAQQSPPAEGDESDLIAVLKSDAELFDKAKACQRLAVIGTEECVPVLAGMLSDDMLAHYARYGLEPIPHDSVDAAFRKAVGELEGQLLVGVVNSIGVRRDLQAVDLLLPLLDDPNPAVAGAAATTLARLRTPPAVDALLEALPGPDADSQLGSKACLIAADKLLSDGKADEALEIYAVLLEADLPEFVQVAALQGTIRGKGKDGMPLLVENLKAEKPSRFRVALAMAHEFGDQEVVSALLEHLDELPADRKALVIYTLGDLEDKAALPAVTEAAQSDLADVRIAAIRVLATLGDASTVPVLLETAAEAAEDLAAAAQQSLIDLSGEGVNEALAKQLEQAEGATRLMVIRIVGDRAMQGAVPALLEAADAADQEVRLGALDALGKTVSLDDLPVLIERMIDPRSGQEEEAAKEALRKACLRAPDRDAVAGQLLAAPLSPDSDAASRRPTQIGRIVNW